MDLIEQPTSPAFQGNRLATWIVVGLLGSLALVLGLTAADNARRGQLERAEEVTAVGDVRFFQLPTGVQKPPPAAVSLQGQPLYPVSYKRYELPHTRMIRAGIDPVEQLSIYTTKLEIPRQEGEREKAGEQFYFLKVSAKHYIRLRASTAGM